MKQGPSTSSHSASKPSIVSHAVSPQEVSRIGLAQAPGTRPAPECRTIGVMAPMSKTTIHHCGSQGKR